MNVGKNDKYCIYKQKMNVNKQKKKILIFCKFDNFPLPNLADNS